MTPFITAWNVLKADNEKCPTCGMKKSHCMQKMGGCGQMKKGIFDSTDRGYYDDPQQGLSNEEMQVMRDQEMADFEAMMDEEDGFGPNYKPQNDDEAAILRYYQQKYSHSNPQVHAAGQELAQEEFVNHLREMAAKRTGVSGSDSAATSTMVGVSPKRIPEQQ
jgi:hypothetical protein